jgi:hypothetical protein
MAQKFFTKDKGWPVPSKFAHVYEELLGNCPTAYKRFFDVASLCHSENEANVSKLTKLEGQEADEFFNMTFCQGKKIIKIYCVIILITKAHFL